MQKPDDIRGDLSHTALRPVLASDRAALMALYPQAFPDEDLRDLVTALLDGAAPVLSLVAADQTGLLGHIAFTLCPGGAGESPRAALLAPLAVAPPVQRCGFGTRLVRAGLSLLQERGVAQVFVLGDPGYYGRFGFQHDRRVLPPYPMPPEWADAWQSLCLPGAAPLPPGPLPLPPVWMQPALWQP